MMKYIPADFNFVKSTTSITTSNIIWWSSLNTSSSLGFDSGWTKLLWNVYTNQYISTWTTSSAFPTSWSISFSYTNFWTTIRRCSYLDSNHWVYSDDTSLKLYSWSPSSVSSLWSITTSWRNWWCWFTSDWKNFFILVSLTTVKSYTLSTARNFSTATLTWTYSWLSDMRYLQYIPNYRSLWPCVAVMNSDKIQLYKIDNNDASTMTLLSQQQYQSSVNVWWFYIKQDFSLIYTMAYENNGIIDVWTNQI